MRTSRIAALLLGCALAAAVVAGETSATVLPEPVDTNEQTPYAVETAADGTSYVPGEFVVKLEDGSIQTRPTTAGSLAEIRDEAAGAEAEAGVEVAGPNFVYELAQGADGSLIGTDEIVDDRDNIAPPPQGLPNDGFLERGMQPNISALKLAGAWNVTRGFGVQVAVVDTGYYRGHVELRDDVVAEYDFVAEDGVAAADTSDPADIGAHHGTMVGGLAAGETNNRSGIAAAGWAATLMQARACHYTCNSADTSAAVRWAYQNGAEVINLSIWAPQPAPGDPVLGAAVQEALDADAVVVAAAGNSYGPDPSVYPSDYPGVLGVGSTVTTDPPRISRLSRRGPGVDVVAPSEVEPEIGVWMPCNPNVRPKKPYCQHNGTSFSAPQVAGIAALVRSYSPGLTQEQVVARIQEQADDFGPAGRDDAWGHGEADARCSVKPDLSGC